MLRLLAAVVLTFVTFTATAQPLFRCNEGGKTVFTDKPCAGTPQAKPTPPQEPVIAPREPDGFAPPYGIWRGETQFQATEKGQRVESAHGVVPMVLNIELQGKIVGASPENGCKALGIAVPGPVKNVLYLDVSLSGCRYVGFNRRFSGTFAYYERDRSAQLSLQSIVVLGAASIFDVKATMRR
jgi:hypothetical protein